MKSILKSVLPLGLFLVGTLLAAAPAGATTVSGFTGQANVASSQCLDKWSSQVDNTCASTVQVHFDIATTASPDHYYAHVYAGSVGAISCWPESWNYDMTSRSYNNPVANGVTGSLTLDLGQINTFNTHSVVCNMGPGTAVHSIDG
jgi:hypothetical protein